MSAMEKFKIYTYCFKQICKDIWRDLCLAFSLAHPKVHGMAPASIAALHSWVLLCCSPAERGTWAFPVDGGWGSWQKARQHSQCQPFLCYLRWGHVVSSSLQLNEQSDIKFTQYLSWTILLLCMVQFLLFCLTYCLVFCIWVFSSIFSRIFGDILAQTAPIKHKEVCYWV